MASPPKALLFDIGGVCVVSPFQAILDYELANNIPPGYINHTIQGTSPNGSWQRIERGEITLGDTWFSLFGADLQDPERWRAYWSRILADPAKRKLIPAATLAQAKDGVAPPVPNIDVQAMFWNMMRMARSPDRYMYPALKKLRASGRFVVAALSNTIAFPEGIRDEKGVLFNAGLHKHPTGVREIGSPAENGGVGDEREDVKSNFEVFISSAHVGMRKPEQRIYELALSEVTRLGKARGVDIQPHDIVFLDDIGGNLKAAKAVGMRTLKVTLGKSRDAVAELEKLVGMKLLDDDVDAKSRL
ncbi:HAD-like protein [Trichodelitschia bisporula]|uniref:HAD-like protein n=1 Tax=Trichodelitschia bisporula TaxID=703511 RepID=A0A6G1HP38_9PEZI|nr:HAD-like protein [Trichodelitschia bisporula]